MPDAKPAPLASFTNPRLSGSLEAFSLEYDSEAGCLALPPDVSVSVGEQPVRVTNRGRYVRTECGGDCEQQGRNGKLRCEPPSFAAEATVTQVVIHLADSGTDFTATLDAIPELRVISPLARPLTVGDQVVFEIPIAAAQVDLALLRFADGEHVHGMYLDPSTRRDFPDGTVGWNLRADTSCSNNGATLPAEASLRIERARDCQGGLIFCAFPDESASSSVTLAFSVPEYCR